MASMSSADATPREEPVTSLLAFMQRMTLDSFVHYEKPTVVEITADEAKETDKVAEKPVIEEVEEYEEPINPNVEEIREILKEWEATHVEQKFQSAFWESREPITMPRDMEDPGYVSAEEVEVVVKVCPNAPKRIRSPPGGMKRRCSASRVLFAETVLESETAIEA